MFCGRTTAAKSAYSEGELKQHELAYSICLDCAKDPENLEKLEKAKGSGRIA
jgi:hypothetical protein